MQLFNYFKQRASDSKPFASPLPNLNRGLLARLRDSLISSGFASAMDMTPTAGKKDPVNTGAELKALKGLFTRGQPLSLQEAERLFEPLLFKDLLETGLLMQSGGWVRAALRVQSYDGLLFFSDFPSPDSPSEAVLSIGPSGQYLASLTIRKPVESALDLGCGCGIQALLTRRHARRVTASDINLRALGMARLNAEWNEVTDIEFLEGSFLEPARGRRFDLILANLPYVITPENRLIARDLGAPDDAIIRDTVRQIPEYLNAGGFAQLMVNWVHKADEAWEVPVMAWLKGLPAEAWVIHHSSQTPQEYTRVWIGINEKKEPRRYRSTTRTWLAWYKKHHIQRLALGVINLRQRSGGGNWTCALHVSRILSEPLGDEVLNLFETQEYLAGRKNARGLLGETLVPRNMKIEQLSAGGLQARTENGFLIYSRIDPATAGAIARLDGRTLLADAIEAAVKDADDSASASSEKVLDEIYHLANLGMIRSAR